MWPLAIGSIVASGIGALAGAKGEKDRRKFDVAQAQKQMDFQERMRNTSWQAAVADMEAAGLNPALAYSHGGAAVPGGASAGPANNVATSAFQAAQMEKTLKLLDAQIAKAKGEAQSAQAAGTLAQDRKNFLTARGTIVLPDGRKVHGVPALVKMLEAEVDSALYGATNLKALGERNAALADIAGPMADLSKNMGQLLPILTLLTGATGPASNLIRALRKGR